MILNNGKREDRLEDEYSKSQEEAEKLMMRSFWHLEFSETWHGQWESWEVASEVWGKPERDDILLSQIQKIYQEEGVINWSVRLSFP